MLRPAPIPKKGKHSVGVAWQSRQQRGKQDDWPVAGQPADGERARQHANHLSLPPERVDDLAQRVPAGAPDDAPNWRIRNMNRSSYDLIVLRDRAALWRAEAAAATLDAMRVFCLSEANECERRVQLSLSTPVLKSGSVTNDDLTSRRKI